MALQKNKIDINFLKTIDESISGAISQTLAKAVNVVATKFGELRKRFGFINIGDNNKTIRTLTTHNRELLALADEGVYKITGELFREVSPAISSEITSEPIIRNVYNQYNPISHLVNDDLITIYEDSRGGFRITVKNIVSDSFLVRDVVLVSGVSKLQLFEDGGKVFLFYKKPDNTIAYKQFESTNYTLIPVEVVLDSVTVGDYFKVIAFNRAFFICGYIEGTNLKIATYKFEDGSEGNFSTACPNKATFVTDASTWFDFKLINPAGIFEMGFDIVYLTGTQIKFVEKLFTGTINATAAIYYYDNMHAITASFLDDKIDIFYDKVMATPQEYLLIYASVSYIGTVVDPVLLGVGLGLYSEAFAIKDRSFVCCSYTSVFQPTYYVLGSDGIVAGKFSKDSGMPHKASSMLSRVIYKDEEVWFPIETRTRLDKEGDFYSQNYGINLVKMNYGYEITVTKELEQYLYMSGSVVRCYDGATLTEAGFLIRPDENMITLFQATSKNTGTLSSGLGAIRVISEGVGGNATINLITGGTYNAEVVGVVGTVIDVQIEDGVSTAQSIVTAIQASVPAEALVDVDVITDGKMNIGASVVISGGATGNLSAGVYQYCVVYAWTDNLGNVHRSTPNIPLSIATVLNDRIQLKIPSLLLTEKDEIWIEIYRTQVNETVFYLAGYCLNDKSQVYTYYMDTLSDTVLADEEVLYTTGGILENDSFAVSSCLAVLDNRLLIANKDSGFVYYTKELKEGFGLGASDFTFVNTGTKGGRIVALKAFKDGCVVFKERAIGIITGQFATDTGVETSLSYDVVTEEFGCVSKSAICEIDMGIIFQSYQGISIFDGGKTSYIGLPVEDKKNFILKTAVVLTDIQTIIFTGSQISYTFNYGKNVWTEFEGCNGFSATHIKGDYYYLDLFGRIQKKDDSAYTDGRSRQPITTKIATPWVQVGNIGGFERFYKAWFTGKLIEPTTFKVSVYFNFNDSPSDVHIYTPLSKKVFGEVFEDLDVIEYNQQSVLESICVYPSLQLCSAFKIEVEEIFPNNIPSAGIIYYGITMECGGKKGWFKQYNKHSETTRG